MQLLVKWHSLLGIPMQPLAMLDADTTQECKSKVVIKVYHVLEPGARETRDTKAVSVFSEMMGILLEVPKRSGGNVDPHLSQCARDLVGTRAKLFTG